MLLGSGNIDVGKGRGIFSLPPPVTLTHHPMQPGRNMAEPKSTYKHTPELQVT